MIVPSGEIMTVRSGSFLPLIRIASDTALTNPPQHGTCILTAVNIVGATNSDAMLRLE